MLIYSISNEDFLYRRLSKNNPHYWKIINGQAVPTSFGFKTKPNEDGLSVNIAALITPEKAVLNYPNDCVAEISASFPISKGYNCLHKPSKSNFSHAIIEGDTNPIARELSMAVTQVFQF